MRTYIYYMALSMMGIACVFNSCGSSEQEKQAERYRDAFRKYAHTDFDNPKDFLSITEVEVVDTITADRALELIGSMEDVIKLVRPSKYEELQRIKEDLNHEVGLVDFRVKVRVRVDGDKRVLEYHGMEDLKNGKITYRERAIKLDDRCVPECYGRLLKLADKSLK